MAMSGYDLWKQRRRAVRSGGLLAREARRGMKRYADRLTPAAHSELQRALEGFDKAQRGPKDEAGYEALVESVNELDKMLDKQLSFAKKSTGREYTEAIGTAVLIALLLRAFVVEAFKIPSGSMIPTLQVGDHIFVNKFIYGIRVPFTNIKFGTDIRKPRRGEVIVFRYPGDLDKDFIKRIVGVAGDVVEIRDHVVFVNNEPVRQTPDTGDCVYDDYIEETDEWVKKTCEAVQEHVGSHVYTTLYNKALTAQGREAGTDFRGELGPSWTFGPKTVPANNVFVMGDNRDNSNDSRFWGTVSEELIKGKAMVIWWSQGSPEQTQRAPWLDWARSLEIVKYFYGARYDRMFNLVQ